MELANALMSPFVVLACARFINILQNETSLDH